MTTAPEEVGGAAPTDLTPGGVLTRRAPATAFEVSLDNFTGPFDLLLGLIIQKLGRNPKEAAYVAFAGGGGRSAQP